MTRVLVVTYGNLLRGDTGLGWLAAEKLAHVVRAPSGRLIACHELAPEIAHDLSQADLALFIEASVRGQPGTIQCQRVEPEPGGESPPSRPHRLTPGALLATAGTLYGAAAETYLVTVVGESFELGSRISQAVVDAMPAVVEKVCQLIEEFGQ